MQNIAEKTIKFNGKNDRVFKSIISKHPKVLEAIISQALERKIKIIELIRPELNIQNVKERVKTVDVLIKTEDNEYMVLELNTSHSLATTIRNFNYFCSFVSQRTKRGNKYDTKSKFIQLSLTYGMPKKMKLKSIAKIKTDDGEELTPNVRFIVWNMDKLKELCYDEGDLEKYKYLHMLDISEIEELERLIGSGDKMDKIVKEYADELISPNSDEDFVWELTAEEEREMLHNTEIELAEEKGIEQGIEQGKNSTAIEIAKNMLNDKEPLEKIVRYTNLSIDEIKEIMASN